MVPTILCLNTLLLSAAAVAAVVCYVTEAVIDIAVYKHTK